MYAAQRWREVFWSGTATAMPKVVSRGVKRVSVRAKHGKKISPSFFSCLDGLSWHLRALHCTVTAFCFFRVIHDRRHGKEMS